MLSKSKFIIIISILFLLLIPNFIYGGLSEGYEVSIYNNTDKIIKDLNIEYRTGDVINTIPSIKAKKSLNYTINTNILNSENAVLLTYKDSNDNKQEDYIVGYLEKGYRGRVDIIIDGIDENGVIKFYIY